MVEVIKDAISKENIATLLDYYRQDDGTQETVGNRLDNYEIRNKAPAWASDEWPRSAVKSTVDLVLQEPYEVEFVFFGASSSGFGLHVDSKTSNNDDRVYKNILIPLDFEGEASTVFFDNYWLGKKIRLDRREQPYANSRVDTMSDYSQLINYQADSKFDPTIQQQYMKHIPLENLHGLTLDQVVEWRIGDAVVFDRSQVHCASSRHNFKTWMTVFANRPA